MLSSPGAHWTLSGQRSFTEQLPGQCYQGITNGYDMICLASLLIKASRGNVADAASHVSQGSVVFAHCRLLFEPLISVVIRGLSWPLASPVGCGCGGGDAEGNQSSY